MNDKITVRKATEQDLVQLKEFEQGVIVAERPFEPQLRGDPIHYYDLNTLIAADNVHLIVAQLGDEIVASGYVRIEKAKPYMRYGFFGYIGFIFVKKEQRGKGIVELILKELEHWTAAQGVNVLHLDVFAGNQSAIKAYEKFGFSPNLVDMRKIIDN